MKHTKSAHHRFTTIARACIATLALAGLASGATLPAPPVSVSLPAEAITSFSIAPAFGPVDGLLYVWTGATIQRQVNVNDFSSFTTIGTVGNGNADAGPLAFSRDNARMLIGAGGGGFAGGADAGKIFSTPVAGGNTNTAVGNVLYHNFFAPAPIGAANDLYFVDSGNATFDASSVSVFNETTGANVPVIANIPGASASGLAMDAANNLYVGIGFGPSRGTFRVFSLASLTTAFNTATPINYSTGALFNSVDNNSAVGVFFDARGYLFAGGSNGLTVFNPLGQARQYDNGDYTSLAYDKVHDRILVTGYGDQQGVYPASMFLVPEPGTWLLAGLMLGFVTLSARRRRGTTES